MSNKASSRFRAKAKHPDSHRTNKADLMVPRFHPFVNASAGIAATGVRVGFPAQRTVSFNYVDYVSLTSTVGSFEKYQFRLNSAFDPDYTGTGHQPMGFDQWALFYNHYVVEEASYQVQICPKTAEDTMFYLTHLSDDPTIPSLIDDLVELGAAINITRPGVPAHIFEGKVDLGKFFNRKDIATDTELRALVTTNPTDQVFLSVCQQPVGGTASTASVALVKLTMRVRFMEPKDLGPSVKAPPTDDEYEFVRVKKVVKLA